MGGARIMVAAALALGAGACSASGSGDRPIVPLAPGHVSEAARVSPDAARSVLKFLTRQIVIGSTIDPLNGDRNPYGLSIDASPRLHGPPTNNLYACNFNSQANVPGKGTTLITLAPKPGSKPKRYIQNNSLLGCAAVANAPGPSVWAAAFGAMSETHVYKRHLQKAYAGGSYVNPFGTIFASGGGLYPYTAIFASDATTGSIVLV
jgi:hypothetical protein